MGGQTYRRTDGLTSKKRQQNTSPKDPLAYFWGVRSCSLLLCLWELHVKNKNNNNKIL